MATAKSFEDELLRRGDIAARFRSLWRDQRNALEEAGFNGDSWKRSAHQVWWSQPRRLRVPATEIELAEMLGVSDKTLYNWRKANPEYYKSGADAARALISEFLPDVIYAAYDMAVHGGKDGAADRRLLAGAGGLTTEKTDITSGGAPLKSYTVLANPDQWDDDDDNGHLDAATVADSTVEG